MYIMVCLQTRDYRRYIGCSYIDTPAAAAGTLNMVKYLKTIKF